MMNQQQFFKKLEKLGFNRSNYSSNIWTQKFKPLGLDLYVVPPHKSDFWWTWVPWWRSPKFMVAQFERDKKDFFDHDFTIERLTALVVALKLESGE